MENSDSIRDEYESKVIGVLRKRESEIIEHYKRVRENIEDQKKTGEMDEESYEKSMKRSENKEFRDLHELDILVMRFKQVGVIDYRVSVFD